MDKIFRVPASVISLLSQTDRLKPSAHGQLSREKADAVLQFLPAMTAGALVILLAMISVGRADEGGWPVGSLAAVLAGAHIVIALAAAIAPGSRKVFSRITFHRVLIGVAVLGVAWAVVLGSSVSAESLSLRHAGLAATVCISFIAVPLFASFPMMGAAFLLPLLSGVLVGVGHLPLGEAWAPAMLVLAMACGVPALALLPARGLVKSFSNKKKVREQKEIISLLLREFGAYPSDWLWQFDSAGRIGDVSARFAAAAPSDGTLVGQDFCAMLRNLSAENAAIALEIEHDIGKREIFHDIIVKVDRDGGEHWWRLTGKPSFDEEGVYSGYVGTASDITTERLAERRISFLAHHDALTELLNRGSFTEHLRQTVARLERYGSPFTILYLDLDKFKSVNDSRGHLVGDKLLAQVAKRICATIRETDLAARLGGDEFAIILDNGCDANDAAGLAVRLIDAICKPFQIDEELVSVGLSIGIAMAPINGTRPDQILRNADLALYRAKEEGRATYRFFETQMDSSMRERRMLEMELRQAIKDGEFVLHYQPLVSAEDHHPNGVEALMRWNHPIRGIVPPVEFIPVAEQTGLIQQIGDWAVREACLAAATWPGDMVVAVNISPKHFQMSDIVAVVKQALADSKLSPQRLELEITESLLIQQPEGVVAKLAELKALGVSIAMDDFGTGYSSLSYLLKFPFDKIKIDKSFVTASGEDPAARDILRTITSLGKSLKIRITAEGVETIEQVEFLREIACNQLQGFYFAKPLNEPDLASYFLSRFVHGKWRAPNAEPTAGILVMARSGVPANEGQPQDSLPQAG